jgi:NAD(P)-dependent dehydrogenase (short-subunit alcohol dehydrogenase family)
VLLGEGRPGHARMTTMSSLGTRDGKIDFDDLQSSNNYKPWPAYNQSKLALTLFAREFAHRTAAQRWVVMSNVAHPGLTVTNLQGSGPNLGRSSRSAMSWTFPWLGRGGARHLAGGYERVLVLAPLLQGHGGIPSVTKDVQTLQRSAARN